MKEDLIWILAYFIAKVLFAVHIISSILVAAGGAVLISKFACWPIPLWLIWIFATSYVSYMQLRFSFHNFLFPEEE